MCLWTWLRQRCECCGRSVRHQFHLTSEGLGGYLCIPCYENGCVHELSPRDRWIHSTVRIRVWNDGGGEGDSNTETMGMTPEQIAELDTAPCPDCGHPHGACGGTFIDTDNPPERGDCD